MMWRYRSSRSETLSLLCGMIDLAIGTQNRGGKETEGSRIVKEMKQDVVVICSFVVGNITNNMDG